MTDKEPRCPPHDWIRWITDEDDTGYLCGECDAWAWEIDEEDNDDETT